MLKQGGFRGKVPMAGDRSGKADSDGRQGESNVQRQADVSQEDDSAFAVTKAKHEADMHRQIAKLRNKGMKHRNRASKFLLKARKADSRAAVMLHKANQLKQEGGAIMEQAKTKAKAAEELKNGLSTSQQNGKKVDSDIQRARLDHEEAKLEKQGNNYLAKAASLTEKATKLKQKSVTYLQKQRRHEMDSAHYLKRAEDIDRSKG